MENLSRKINFNKDQIEIINQRMDNVDKGDFITNEQSEKDLDRI